MPCRVILDLTFQRMFHPRLFSRRDESICEFTIQVEEWNYAPERLSLGACFLGELQKKKKRKMQNSSLTSSLPTRLPAPTKCDFSPSRPCCLGLGGSPRAQRSGSSRSVSDLGLGKPGFLCFTSFQLTCSLSFDDGTEATNYSSVNSAWDVLTRGIRDVPYRVVTVVGSGKTTHLCSDIAVVTGPATGSRYTCIRKDAHALLFRSYNSILILIFVCFLSSFWLLFYASKCTILGRGPWASWAC